MKVSLATNACLTMIVQGRISFDNICWKHFKTLKTAVPFAPHDTAVRLAPRQNDSRHNERTGGFQTQNPSWLCFKTTQSLMQSSGKILMVTRICLRLLPN